MVVLGGAGAGAPDRLTTATRVVLVVNPAARRAAVAEARAVAAFARAGVPCEVRRTERPGHAATLARTAGTDPVFVLGGDGTAMEVVGALADSGVAVGIVPGGTGNLVARMLGTPLDPARAVPALLGGRRAHVDLGRVRATGPDGAPAAWRHFAFSAGVGIDAHMIERTPAAWKRRFGIAAYTLVAARAALTGAPFDVRVTVDDAWDWHGRATSLMVANFGAVLGDRFPLGPGIRADDGVLDLCVLAPRGRRDGLRALARLARHDFRPDPALVYRPGGRFRIDLAVPRAAQADGELLGVTPLVVETMPRAAVLLVPAASPLGRA